MASDLAGIGVLTLDTNYRVQSWNHWLEAATGLTEVDVRGRDVGELSPPARGSIVRDACADVIANGTTRVLSAAIHGCVIACPPRRASSPYDEMQQHVTFAAMRSETGIVGVIVTVEDVTDRLVAERALVAQSGASDWRARADATRVLKEAASREQVAELLASLQQNHHDFSVLSGALAVLAAGNREVVLPLIKLLADPSPNLRMHAALALGAVGDAAATGALIGALEDDDPNVRFHAIESLGRLGAAEAVGPLGRVAASGDFFLTFPAIDALARIEDPSVVPTLISLLTDQDVRPAVVDAIAVLGDEDCVGPLAGLINNGTGDAAATCAALQRIGVRYERETGDAGVVADLVRRALTPEGVDRVCDAVASRKEPLLGSITVAGWIGPPALPSLVSVLGAQETSAAVAAAIAALGRHAIAPLTEVLLSGERDARIAAAGLLGAIGDRRATPALVRALSSHDTEVVVAAVTALATLADPDSLEPVLALLAHDGVMVRQGALAAVNSLGDARVKRYALNALHSEDSRVRESAVRIAGYFGFEDAVPGIIAALGDDSEDVRRVAIEQLAILDDAGAEQRLLTALQSETPRNRAAAAHALRSVSGNDVETGLLGALSDGDVWVRYFAAESLGTQRASERTTQALMRLASGDEAPHVRIAAIGGLANAAAEGVAELLLEAARDQDENVAAAAVKALSFVTRPEAEAFLTDTIRGPRLALRLAAAAALTGRADAQAVAALQTAAETEEPAELAVIALDGLRKIASSAPPCAAREAVDALVALGCHPHRRDAVVDALASLGRGQVAWLRELYAASSVEARVLLVHTAARIRLPEASAIIADALSDGAKAVRIAAVTAVGRLGSSFARLQVVSLSAADPDAGVRRLAATVCRRHGWERQPHELADE